MIQTDAVQFRRVRDTDLGEIINFVRSADELFLFAPAASYPLSIDALQVIIHQRLHASVLVYQQRVAGFANFYQYEKGESIFLGNLVVHPQLRGKGLGTLLVKHMLADLFKHYDVREARLSVFAGNHAAMNLYTSFGFRMYAKEWRRKPNGEKVLLHHMQLFREQYLAGVKHE